MPAEEFIFTNHVYYRSDLSESAKKCTRGMLLTQMMQAKNFFDTITRLQNSEVSDSAIKPTLGTKINSMFLSLGIFSPNAELVIDLTNDLLEIINRRPRYQQDYDLLDDTQKKHLHAKTVRKLFKEPSLQTYLRSCQTSMLNQTEAVQNIIIEKHLKQRLSVLKISYPAIRHDQEFAENVKNILTKAIKYNHSQANIIRLQKYDLISRAFTITQNMPLETCRPTAAMRSLLAYEKEFFERGIFEVAGAFKKFQSGMTEAIQFAEELDRKLIKPALPIKSILATTSLASLGTLWLGIDEIPILAINSILWAVGGYYNYVYNKPQFIKGIISVEDIKKISEKFTEALKFKKVPSDNPQETIYSNLLPSPETDNTLNQLLSNLSGERLGSSHAYLSRELGMKKPTEGGKKEEKKAKEPKLDNKSTVPAIKKVTTWLNGIIRSDNINDIKEGGTTGYFWIVWDSFSKNYSDVFRRKLDDNLSRNTASTFCSLKGGLASKRKVVFVEKNSEQENIAIINNGYEENFDNEIKCDKKGFSSFLLKADQSDGKALRVVCIEIPHLITPKAKRSFAATTETVEIKLTPRMIDTYRKLQKTAKEEDEEIKHSSLQL